MQSTDDLGDLSLVGVIGFNEKDKYSLGITAIKNVDDSRLIIGTGEGLVDELMVFDALVGPRHTTQVKKMNKTKDVIGKVTSIALRGKGHQFFVATDRCHLYRFAYSNFDHQLIKTCHNAAVNDVRFPHNCSDLFATCSFQDIRIFNTKSCQEVLRITIPNMTCFGLDIKKDGTAIVSGWDDSRIRAFYPETGRLMYTIQNAHKKGVTAVSFTSTSDRIISGGGEGQIRVWNIKEVKPLKTSKSQRLHRGVKARGDGSAAENESTFITELAEAMHEHTNAVSCIQVSKDDKSCVSASADSTCIVWCLETYRRKQIIFSNTLFRCICYHSTECQLLTSGTDRKIGYWEVYDGSLIRQLEGSRSGSVNGMDITQDGKLFVTGGDDKLVKVWQYDAGVVTHVGLGHTSPITRLRISPDHQIVITVSEDGAIYLWNMPPSSESTTA